MDNPLNNLNIGLKNINPGFLLKKKDLLIAIAILVFLALAAKEIYQSQRKRINALKAKIDTEDQRIALGNELKGVMLQISQISAPYLKRDASIIIDLFREFASKAQVKIVSLTASNEHDQPHDVVVLFNLILEAQYHNLGNFISILESQRDILQIENISITNAETKGKDAQVSSQNANKLSVKMIVSATFIKGQ